jgi:hypothetical protein
MMLTWKGGMLLVGDGFVICAIDFGQSDYRVRESAACPHLCSNPNGLHDLLRGCAIAKSRSRMTPDAVGTLSHVRDGDSNDVLHLPGKRAIVEHRLPKRVKRS